MQCIYSYQRNFIEAALEQHIKVRSAGAAEVDEFEDRVMFGEIYAPLDDLMKYYGAKVCTGWGKDVKSGSHTSMHAYTHTDRHIHADIL